MDKENLEKKRQEEIQILSEMIAFYCRKKHGNKGDGELCEECKELKEYACLRSKRCPFMEDKTFCSDCKVHCYSPVMQAKIKEVMRYSGPGMLLSHPLICIRHAITGIKAGQKKKGKKPDEN